MTCCRSNKKPWTSSARSIGSTTPRAFATCSNTSWKETGLTNVVCLKVPNASETLNSTIYFNTRPEAWTQHYIEANHIFHDPMVRELYKTYDPYSWTDVLKRRELEPDDQRIVEEAGEFGMKEGFVVPVYQLNGYFGLGQRGRRLLDFRSGSAPSCNSPPSTCMTG